MYVRHILINVSAMAFFQIVLLPIVVAVAISVCYGQGKKSVLLLSRQIAPVRTFDRQRCLLNKLLFKYARLFLFFKCTQYSNYAYVYTRLRESEANAFIQSRRTVHRPVGSCTRNRRSMTAMLWKLCTILPPKRIANINATCTITANRIRTIQP